MSEEMGETWGLRKEEGREDLLKVLKVEKVWLEVLDTDKECLWWSGRHKADFQHIYVDVTMIWKLTITITMIWSTQWHWWWRQLTMDLPSAKWGGGWRYWGTCDVDVELRLFSIWASNSQIAALGFCCLFSGPHKNVLSVKNTILSKVRWH